MSTSSIMGIIWELPPPVTVYIRGPIKGYIYPYYNYYPTVTEGVQYPRCINGLLTFGPH